MKRRLVPPRATSLYLAVIICSCLNGGLLFGQSASDSDAIRGVVLNSVTREPIARALVYSPDNQFATLTNSEGRFEFNVPKAGPANKDSAASNGGPEEPAPADVSDRPSTLLVRKPGFVNDPYSPGPNVQNSDGQDVTLVLIPEALIVGAVSLPASEASETVSLQLFRRVVQEGSAHFVPVGNTQSKSDGQFRFAELGAGTYKLMTREMLDRNPLGTGPGEQQLGYPPAFYQNAPDFGTAATIELSAGQTQTVTLSLAKQPYYRVRIPVISPGVGAPGNGVVVGVYVHGHKGPGFALGYNNTQHAIVGSLPNGTYIVEATNYTPNGESATGVQAITIKGGPVDGPALTLLPNGPIPVSVKEEFTAEDQTGNTTWNIRGREVRLTGPRRYLNISLDPVDDREGRPGSSLRNPRGVADEPLVIEGAPPGSYWVRVNSSRGYPASVRSGNLDLQHQPLVIGTGGAPAPIEITMRDDMAGINGKVEGIPATRQSAPPAATTRGISFYNPSMQAGPHLYCVPLADSSGQFMQISLGPDGSFDFMGLAPGAYRLLAFDREQPELEYRNPEAMRAYESEGPVIHVAGREKERVTLQMIVTDRP